VRARLAILASLLALALAGAPTPASAAIANHPFLKKLIGAEPDPGARHPQAPFEDPCGVAVDPQGDIYVSDYYHDAIDIFASDGRYITQIAAEDPGNGPCALAVDSAGVIYANNWRHGVLRLAPSSYPPDENTTYSSTVIASGPTATGVAIDPISANIYVDEGTYIAEFEPSGAVVQSGGQPVRIGLGTLTEGYGLAVSSYSGSEGDIYVADAAAKTIRVYDPAGNPLPSIDGRGSPQGGFDYLIDGAVAVDPTDGHVFLADNVGRGASEHPEAVIDEFNPAGDYRGQIAHWFVKVGEPPVLVEFGLSNAEPSAALAIGPAGNVYVTSGNSEGAELDFFGPTVPAATLTVSKTGAGLGTLTSKPAGISCGTACSAEYNTGEAITLTATPDPHSSFAGFSGGGCSGTAPCHLTMSEARAVSAEFLAIPQGILEVGVAGSGEGTVTSSPAGISCSSATCSEHFNQASTVTLTATPKPHSRFAGWGGVDCDESTLTTCEIEISAAKAISATFTAIPQQTLTVKASGAGTLTSQPLGIACGAICAADFDQGASVTLSAVPAAHNQVSWSGCDSLPSPGECVVTIGEARLISAVFTPIQHLLTVGVRGAGSVSAEGGTVSGCAAAGGSCSGSFEEGEAIVLRATPDPGSVFAGWSGGCAGTAPCHLDLEADTAVTANFAPLPPAPIPAALKLGKLTVRGSRASLQLSVSGPGTLSASGAHLQRATASAEAAGPLTLHLALSGSGQKALRRAKHGTLRVKVALTFMPNDGAGALTLTKAVSFSSADGRRPKSRSTTKKARGSPR
jgi:hypothetical protein